MNEQSDRCIVTELQLVALASTEALLDDHILPWMVKPKSGDKSVARMQLLEWIFGEVKAPDARVRNLVSRNLILPVHSRSSLQQFCCLNDLVDPRSESAILYFEDEPVFPTKDFFRKA